MPTMPTARMTRSTVSVEALPPASMRRGDAVGALLQRLHRGAGVDLHALLLERLAGEGGDLLVLDRQDAVEHLDHRHLGAQIAVEAGEFDADGARADDQQRFRHRLAAPSPRVGPDQLAVGLQPGQRARARAGGEDDVLGGELGDRLAVLGRPRACPCRPASPCPSITVILFFFIRKPTPFDSCLATARERSTTLLEVEADVLGREAVVVEMMQQMVDLGRCAAAPWSGCSPS